MQFESKIKTIEWVDNYSKMVDQTVIPYEYKFINITTGQGMFDAIRNMIVRGAPAIGIAGAHGVLLYAQEGEKLYTERHDFVNWLLKKAEYIKSSRPTAVNLMWACEKQIEIIKNSKGNIQEIINELKENAIKLENEDIEYDYKTLCQIHKLTCDKLVLDQNLGRIRSTPVNIGGTKWKRPYVKCLQEWGDLDVD